MGGGIALWALALAAGASFPPLAVLAPESSHPKSLPRLLPERPASAAVAAFRTVHFFQGFEAGVPPAGWTRTSASTVPFTWHATTDSTIAHEAIRTAAVDWTDAAPQDELLTSPAIDLSGVAANDLRFTFWWYGDPFWARNADFVVLTSANGTAWTEAWRMSDVAGTGFAWRFASLDAAAHAGGALFARFRYVGRDGASLLVDEVSVVSDEPSPLPPENDDCAGAVAHGFILAPGPFDVTADNSLAAPDYPLSMPGSCTGYSHSGRDLVWAVDLVQGHSIVATMTTTGDWDDTLFLLDDCANPQGACLAGDNALPDGSGVSFTRADPGTGRYYLVASGYANGAGIFRLQGSVGPLTAIAPASWGRVKARYR